MEKAQKEAIERILRHHTSSLSDLPTDLVRNHILEEVACTKCGKISILVRKRCRDLLCRHCCTRGCQPLYKSFDSLQIDPRHLITWVLPLRPISLQNLRKEHVTRLQKALAKFRDQAHFKRVIKGGYTHLELSINERLSVHLHAHLLLQTFQPVHARPMDLPKVKKAWYRLTGQSPQRPIPLERFTEEEARNAFRYISKSIRSGERSITILRALEDYAEETEGQYRHSAMQLRVYILRRYNSIFRGKHKRGFFGSWYGIKPEKAPGKREYQCRCGSRAPLTPLSQ